MAPSVRVSYAVMHHPARPAELARIVADFEAMGATLEVVVDPEPFGPANPWRCAREAWARTPSWCTHRMVVQDDALVCDGFPDAVQAALEARPDVCVSWFVNDLSPALADAQLAACDACLAWAEFPPVHSWFPTVCVSLPREVAQGLGAYTPAGGRNPIADDAVLAQYLGGCRTGLWQTVPSLVQHDEEAPSTISGHRKPWARPRTATCFLGPEVPHTAIDWTRW